MKATLHAAENPRTKIGKIVGECMYVKYSALELPDDFIIYSQNLNPAIKHGVRPVQDYQAGRDLVKKLNQ